MPSITNDAILWYNTGKWSKLGLAVPNWSDDGFSKNRNVRYLCRIMGRNLQALMFTDDARLTTPPTIGTLISIHKLCIRARDILAARSVPSNEVGMTPKHANPSPEVHLVYPTPYFMVRNPWMKDWCELIITAMTEAMQHQENAKSLEISVDFAKVLSQYVKRVYRNMSIEMFRVGIADAKKDNFTLNEQHFQSYDPSTWFTDTEMIDTVPELFNNPTEDMLKPLSDGIPTTELDGLGGWPGRPGSEAIDIEEAGNVGSSFI